MPARRALYLLAVLPLLLGSCRYFRMRPELADTSAAAAEPAAAPQASGPARTGSLRDANIAAMLLASNNTDISYARLVPSRTQRDDLRQFAERMLTDHTGLNALINQLLARLDMGPEENLASLDMRDESATRRDLMRDLSGFAFDSAYITNEVSHHQKFLASIDNVMLPRARHEELRALLTTLRPAVAAHLAHAETLWANVMARR